MPVLKFCLRAQGFCLRADILSYAEFPLAYAHQNLGLRHTLTRGPFPNMNARVWTWLICRKSKLSTKITCPCDCRDPPSIKQKVHLFHSMGDGSIPILGDFHVWSGWWLTYPSEKWWSSSVGMDDFPNIWKNKTCSKPPTSDGCFWNVKVPLNISQYSLWL